MFEKDIKAISFYLPQFHPVKENSEWWGEGFTEWTNVAKAVPNFDGHYQPHIPSDLGFYDLRLVDNMRKQAQLAESYGIYGFCFYYYWFDQRRILELPLNQYLASDIDFPFCYCWANENWTRTWDGLDKEVLLGQQHSDEDDTAFIRNLLPVFADHRYIKVDGKPMLLVYRVDLFPDMQRTAKIWREEAKKAGFPDLHLCAVQFYGIDDPTEYGFDAAVEFPPHKFVGPENRPDVIPPIANSRFTGGLVDYRKVMAQGMQRPTQSYRWYRGIVPSWDNTARRQHTAHTLIYSSPKLFRFWLQYLVDFTRKYNPEDGQYVFINAWNEWAEGAHLEPDLKYGHAYLEAVQKALNGKKLDLADYMGNADLSGFLLAQLTPDERAVVQRALGLEMAAPVTIYAAAGTSALRYRDILRIKFPTCYRLLRKLYSLTR
ncbi:glycoside hydrolase family 99-like domain-containing protein [Silvimonas sp.]|uniref:glycosyltransferase WbsX family protein n=1 Tax=Silvimonas sp. TaxID=2650811 RepID=UPI00283FB313|nr:glycoside hydrolase family 99-like domain-containing protein [Silvimonas sp.]MDR3429436.1 glycoside hydrolase family 99-like domain-containing protein [Silvimonas sp.]